MLNQAVNQQDRGDVVLMKTLVQLNYYERMETKKSYEETYQTVALNYKNINFQLIF